MGSIAGPLIGAGVGLFGSQQASSKASKAQRDASKDIQAAATAARNDALRFFPLAKQELLTGAQGAFDIFGQAIPLQQQQLAAGNLAAQQTTAQGFNQAQAALLGLPTEQFQTQGVPFSQEPFLGGQSLFGTPLELFPGGEARGSVPTFAGLGGTFRDPFGHLQTGASELPTVNPLGEGGLGTPIPNPNLSLFTPERGLDFLRRNTDRAVASLNAPLPEGFGIGKPQTGPTVGDPGFPNPLEGLTRLG